MESEMLAFVMAGGMGERLRPLTEVRAKPAVPFGGTYRIIDFTLSNCINSGVRKIYVLTQYKSYSLSNHLKAGWSFLPRRLRQFIDEVPAQMQLGNRWYDGTADAIRQNLGLIQSPAAGLVLILSGDHVYKMDYRLMREFHVARGAAVTVAVIRVPTEVAAGRYGVLVTDEQRRIVGFEEKPPAPQPIAGSGDCHASMGIYLFDREVLAEWLDADFADYFVDFGKDVLPAMVDAGLPVYAFDFTSDNRIPEYVHVIRDGRRVRELVANAPDAGYWRDVGSLDSYWHANLDLVAAAPAFNLYGTEWALYNCPLHLPPAKFVHETQGRTGMALQSIVCDGVIVSGARIRRSVLGPGLFVHSHATIESSVLMGGGVEQGIVTETMIGRGCRIRNAIIDKRARIEEGTVIGYDRQDDERRGLTTQTIAGTDEYVVVVPKGKVVG